MQHVLQTSDRCWPVLLTSAGQHLWNGPRLSSCNRRHLRADLRMRLQAPDAGYTKPIAFWGDFVSRPGRRSARSNSLPWRIHSAVEAHTYRSEPRNKEWPRYMSGSRMSPMTVDELFGRIQAEMRAAGLSDWDIFSRHNSGPGELQSRDSPAHVFTRCIDPF